MTHELPKPEPDSPRARSRGDRSLDVCVGEVVENTAILAQPDPGVDRTTQLGKLTEDDGRGDPGVPWAMGGREALLV